MSAVFGCTTRQISRTPASAWSSSGSTSTMEQGGLIQLSGL
jgi:hypothetical protein